MSPSQNCYDLIKRFESCKLEAYLCPSGLPTIGWGHTGPDVALGQSITQERADELLVQDVSRFAKEASQAVKTPLSQGQFDAVVSFAFNCKGWRGSTLVKLLNEGKADEASLEFPKWVHGRNGQGKPVVLAGLVSRRTAEKTLFSSV